jgi:hypothetical protein
VKLVGGVPVRRPDRSRSVDAESASGAERPLVGRTATVDDPLTTSLLAEVARRSHTIEVSPDQIDDAKRLAAKDLAADPEPSDDPT